MPQIRADNDKRTFVHTIWANVADSWGTNADAIDERGAVVTAQMLDALDLRPGERVLELACGPGGAGLAAADLVGPEGEVVVSDVVPAMVDIAAKRAAARGIANVRAEVLDLEDIAQPDAAYDAVLCREGMMFAVDPAHAAREMYRVLRLNGRLAVSVWAARADNPWLGLLMDAIAEITGIVVPQPGMPGPFALADADALCRMLAGAGFTDIVVDRASVPLRSPSFDAWWERNLTVAGPIAGILARLDDATRTAVRDRVRAAVGEYEIDGGALELPGLTLLLSARRQ
jgi:ubiquinone/menaquinone biosynthesis C-methylase UbiE